ncbi:MAG: hypothetical protein ACOYJF_08515 [Prevotella sp.]|jgi:hypothetical protein
MKNFLLFLVLSLTAIKAGAQTDSLPVLRKLVVADMETRVPVRDVKVITNTGHRDTTNYRGVCYIPEKFDTLVVYKANYLTEKLAFKDVKDTTYLLPNSHRVGEVTVWGDDRQRRLDAAIERWSKGAASEGAAEAPSGIFSFDLGKILDRRKRHDMKQLRKTTEAFKQMDQKGNEDPIVAAYNRTLEAKRLESERNKVKQDAMKVHEQEREKKLQQTISAYEKVPTTDDTLRAKLLEGVYDEESLSKVTGRTLHTYYLPERYQLMNDSIQSGKLTKLSQEEFDINLTEYESRWSKLVLSTVNEELSDDQKDKLMEDKQSLRIYLAITKHGRVLVAQLVFSDPYQAVMLPAERRRIIDKLQSLRLPGVENIPDHQYFGFNFVYMK